MVPEIQIARHSRLRAQLLMKWVLLTKMTVED